MNQAPPNSDFALPGPAAPGVGPAALRRRSAAARWAWAFAVLVLVLSLLALGLAWRVQQRVRGIEQELVKRQQDSAGQATEARVLSKAAEDSSRDAVAKVALLEARLAEMSSQRSQLDDAISQLSRSRDDNVVADVDGAIRVAMQQMLITGAAEPLLQALHQADDRLARSNQPRLDVVRRAIARDLDRLRSVGTVNISSLSIKLDEAVRLVDDLPLTSGVSAPSDARPADNLLPAAPVSRASSRGAISAPAASRVASQPQQPPTWYGHEWLDAWSSFWDRVWTEARGLVRVTQIDHPEAMLIAPDNAFFLRENLKLRLLNARLAVLSRQFDTAQLDLQTVQSSLERYFDRSSRKVGVAIENVRQVAAQARQVVLPRPDDTLAALAALAPAPAAPR